MRRKPKYRTGGEPQDLDYRLPSEEIKRIEVALGFSVPTGLSIQLSWVVASYFRNRLFEVHGPSHDDFIAGINAIRQHAAEFLAVTNPNLSEAATTFAARKVDGMLQCEPSGSEYFPYVRSKTSKPDLQTIGALLKDVQTACDRIIETSDPATDSWGGFIYHLAFVVEDADIEVTAPTLTQGHDRLSTFVKLVKALQQGFPANIYRQHMHSDAALGCPTCVETLGRIIRNPQHECVLRRLSLFALSKLMTVSIRTAVRTP